jgi:beta-lactam-binding protein with PASTA domain
MRLIFVALFFWLAALTAPSWAQATPPQAAPPGTPTRNTILTVNVVDEFGKGIPGMTVNVAHGGWLGTTRATDYTGATNSAGAATFIVRLGRYTGEDTFGTTIKIEVTDQVEGKINRRRATYDQVTISYGLPAVRRTLVMMPGGTSSDNVAGIPVRVKVVDAEGNAVDGAVVSVQSQSMDRKREQPTNAQGIALLEATVYSDVAVTVEASKPNYKPARKSFRLNPRMRSQGVIHEETLELAKLPGADTQATLRISVINSTDKNGVADARVRFVPLDGSTASFGGRTANDGLATVYSSARGRFRVEVTQDNFQPAQFEVALDRKDLTLGPVELVEKPKKTGDSEVTVTVLAGDKIDGQGRPQPIPGAHVVHGNTSAGTDERGQVKIEFTGQLGADLRVSAAGYKPGQISVPGGRYVTSNFTRTVTLQPADADEKTPIALIVRVVSSVGNDVGVPGVKIVILASNGGKFAQVTTGPNGEAPFTFAAAAADQARSGLYIETEATTGFANSRTEIVADRLKPSKEPLRHVVVLTSTTSTGLAALVAEVARLERLRADILKDHSQAQAEARIAQKAAEEASQSLSTWQNDIQNFGTGQGTTSSAAHREAEVAIFCKAAYDVATEYDRSADRKAREATELLDAARGEAQRCTAQPGIISADAILRGYQLALGKSAELEFDQRQAQSRKGEFDRMVGAVEQKFKSSHYTAMQQAMNTAYAADKEASRLVDGTVARRQQLAQGKAAADRQLNALRGGPALQPQDYAQLTSLKGRIDALLPLPETTADGEANAAARAARASIEAANRTVGAYSQAGCKRAMELYPKVVEKLEQNAIAIALAVRNTADLPQRAQECRAQAAANAAAAAANALPPGVAEVPDLSRVAPGAMAGFLQSRQLAWGGYVAAGPAPNPGQAGQFAGQSHAPGTRVAIGTPVSAGFWGNYAAAPVAVPPPVMEVTVPNLAQYGTRWAIEDMIRAAGLVPVHSTMIGPAPRGREGQFVAQDPPPGWRVARGTRVTFVTYADFSAPQQPIAQNVPPIGTGTQTNPPGQQPTNPVPLIANPQTQQQQQGGGRPTNPVQPPTTQQVTSGVPNVVGQTLEQAQAILNRAGLRVGGIERGSRPPTPDWATRIYFQVPAAGSPLPGNRAVALKQYGSMSETSAVVPSGDGVCLTSEGPLGCTGRFIGQYRLDCTRIQPTLGQGILALGRDGSAELTMTQPGGPPYSVRGSINAAGTVVLIKQGPREFQRWDGQFRLVAAANGLRKVQGNGTYQNKFTDEKNAVTLQCTGSYTLQ